MKKNIKRRTEMFIEIHEITIIRTKEKQQKAFCEICQSLVFVFPIEQLAEFIKIDSSEVCRLIETNKFHLAVQNRFALVCGNSLNGDEKYSLQIKKELKI